MLGIINQIQMGWLSDLNPNMRYPTMWYMYVRPAKAHTILRAHMHSLIRALARILNVLSLLVY